MHELTITGNGPAQRLVLEDGRHTIGRLPGSAVHLDSDGVSREHGRIDIDGESATLVDLGSTNGILLDGKRVKTRLLADGDTFSIGSIRLSYRFAEVGDQTRVATFDPTQEPSQLPVPARPPKKVKARSSTSQAVESVPPPPAPKAPKRKSPPPAPPMEDEELEVTNEKRPTIKVNYKLRLGMWLIGLVALSALFIGSGVLRVSREMMALEGERRAQTLTYLLAEMNLLKLRNGDVQLITKPIADSQGVTRAILLNEVGDVLAPERYRGTRDELLERAHASDEFKKQLTREGALYSVPIAFGSRRFGTAIVDFSLGYLEPKLQHMRTLIFFFGIFLALVALLGAAILEKIGQRPFLLLSEEVDLVVKRNFRSDVPKTTDKKVNRLVDSLNRLVHHSRLLSEKSQTPQAQGSPQASKHLNALGESLKLFREGLLQIDAEGCVVFASPRVTRMLGCSERPEVGVHLLDALVDSPGRAELLGLLQESRRDPGQKIVRPLQSLPRIEARLQTDDTDGTSITWIVLERRG